jgi:hypothetical protein
MEEVSLTAYSGGTVWDLHPLRLAAGANVMLCQRTEHSGHRALAGGFASANA